MKVVSKTHLGNNRWSGDDELKMKAMVAADFSELLNHDYVEGLRWTSTKTDLRVAPSNPMKAPSRRNGPRI